MSWRLLVMRQLLFFLSKRCSGWSRRFDVPVLLFQPISRKGVDGEEMVSFTVFCK